MFRACLYWTGLHLRCRSCGEVYRLVETTGGVVAVFAAFGAAYVLAFRAWLEVPVPVDAGPWQEAIWIAVVPAIPAVLVALFVGAWLGRMGAPRAGGITPLGSGAFATVYVLATVGTSVSVILIVFGMLLAQFGEPMPRPEFEPRTAPVAVASGEAEQFVFVDLAGTPRSLAGLNGSVVFVHLFDPDDRDARAELETIRQLRKEAVDDGVLFAVVAECSRDRLAMFVDDGAPPLPYTWTDAPLPTAFSTLGEGRPVTFVVDRDGRVVYSHAGVANWATEETRRFLAELARGG